MSRVSKATYKKVHDYFDNLPTDKIDKCSLCNDSLVDIVSKAEIQTGAGPATITKVLAERHNKTAAPMDKVTGSILQDRIRNKLTYRNKYRRQLTRTGDLINKTKWRNANIKFCDKGQIIINGFLCAGNNPICKACNNEQILPKELQKVVDHYEQSRKFKQEATG